MTIDRQIGHTVEARLGKLPFDWRRRSLSCIHISSEVHAVRKRFFTFTALAFSVICVIGIVAFCSCGTDDDDDADDDDDDLDDDADDDDDDGFPCVWDQVRAGHWVHAVNLPWDNYGTDFGESAWGYRGLANQGPAGWRCKHDDDSQGCASLDWNDGKLVVNLSLNASDQLRSNAITYYCFEESAALPSEGTIDLRGKTVAAQASFPAGSQGPSSAPNEVVLFLQDINWNWGQSAPQNIVPGDMTLSVVPDTLPDFDETQVRCIGISMTTNDEAPDDYTYDGSFTVDYVQSPPEINFPYDTAHTRTEDELLDIAGLGATATRVWLFADGRSGLAFDPASGEVSGLNQFFKDDFDELIRLADSSRLYLIVVLFDFLMGGSSPVEEPGIFGHADLITDPAKRDSLIGNALIPLFEEYGDRCEILSWELMNEPEWLLINDPDHVTILAGKRPSEIATGGAATFDQMTEFFNAVLEAYQTAVPGGQQLFTVGSASEQWADQWYEALNMDLGQFHFWNGPAQIDEGLSFDFTPPIAGVPNIMGEFSSEADCCEILESALELDYSGAWPWAYRSKDESSFRMLGDDCRECMQQFAEEHPETVRFE
ncbi:MAG: hypothetical protein P9M14_06715 [Candidatus Alcyoniella australis]|nr:hypothetical protein [Candidatus Alcyoniella australis]